MKYRIKKYYKDTLESVYQNCIKVPIVNHNEWYQASRKGKIFGFWHAIGHEYSWDELIPYKVDNLKDMEKYIEMWHKCHYGNSCKYEIIKDIKI